jgi:hypothetical protein
VSTPDALKSYCTWPLAAVVTVTPVDVNAISVAPVAALTILNCTVNPVRSTAVNTPEAFG